MRVLHLDTGRTMRGGQYQALHLIRGLIQDGHECLLLAPQDSPLHATGIPAARLTAASLLRAVGRFDLIHAHDSGAHNWALLSSGILVVSRRVAFPRKPSAISRWKYSQVHRFLAISNYVGALLESEGVPADRIAIVHDGVPPLTTTSATPDLVVAPAINDPRKGSALAVEAARLAGVSVRFSTTLEEDLPRAAVFLYLSELEGLGSAALLAQSAGVPVIASRVGGLSEAIEDQVTGLLVDNNAATVAAAIRSLLDDPARARAMGEAGRLRAQQDFSIARLVKRTLEEYRFTLKCFGRTY